MGYLRATGLAAVVITAALAGQAHAAPARQTRAQVIDDLVAANHILAHEGIMPAFGHVSARSPDNPSHFFISRSLPPPQVTAADIVELDLDCNPVTPTKALLYQERWLHCAIYKARPDVGAVTHSHTPYVVAFSASKTPMRPVVNGSLRYGANGPPIFDVSTVVPRSTNNLIGQPGLGTAMAAALGKASTVLLRGHGSAVTATDVRAVVQATIGLENAAKILAIAIGLGSPVTYQNPDDYLPGPANAQMNSDAAAEDRGWLALKEAAGMK